MYRTVNQSPDSVRSDEQDEGKVFYLDLSEGDEEGIQELGVQAKNAGRMAEVAVGCSESVHCCSVGLR